MAVKITSTKDVAFDGVKVLVHGPAGIGKTVLCKTAPLPIIISAEAGLLSLADMNIPVIEVTTVNEVNEAYMFLTESEESKKYETVCLDSITEIAEVLLSTYKGEEKDARQAYGRLNDDIASTIRSFRDLKGKHVYFTSKQLRVENDNEPIRYVPSMPGKTTLNAMPYFFDIVLAMRIGKLEDETVYRYLQTYPDLNYEAKDRSGKLPPRTKPDLTDVFERIGSSLDNINTETKEKETE